MSAMKEKKISKKELIKMLVTEYKEYLESCDYEEIRDIYNSTKFDIRPW